MDIKERVGQKGSQGNQASEYSDFVARSGSWQYGKDARCNDVEAEKKEEDVKFGVVNYTENSTANESQYGNRGPEQHAVKNVGQER